MADKLIRDLTEETVNDSTYYTVIDDASFTEAKKITVDNFLLPEATIRQTDDETIRDAVGLETDYTYAPNESSNYIKTSDFVAAGINADLINATNLLDAAIYNLNNKLFLEVYITLSWAELQQSNTLGGTVISAPSAGYFINIHDILGQIIPTPYINEVAGDTLDFNCGGITLGFLSNNFLKYTSQTIEKAALNRGDGINLTPGSALLWKTTTTDLQPPPMGGGGTIKLRFLFELLSDAFSSTPAVLTCCNTPVTGTFVDADLNGLSQLVIHHSKNTEIILGIVVIDPNGVSTLINFQTGDGDNLFINKADYVTIDFGGSIAAGTWTYYFIATQI